MQQGLRLLLTQLATRPAASAASGLGLLPLQLAISPTADAVGSLAAPAADAAVVWALGTKVVPNFMRWVSWM